MTDIPEDVSKAAYNALCNALRDIRTGFAVQASMHTGTADAFREAIARAIKTERERCAGVARLAMVNNPDADEYTCTICAAEIRKGAQ